MLAKPRVVVTCAAAALALLIAAAPSAAAPKRITGKLSKPGYTVMALAAGGGGKTVLAAPRFKLRPLAQSVSLHLRRPDGVYAGPVVVGTRKRGRRALVGVRQGARLGLVRVRARKGIGTAKVAKRWLDFTRVSRARRGVPIGARKFGLVRSKLPRKRPPGDRDADGIADLLDIDANGNLVLDRYESQAAERAARNRGGDPTAVPAAQVTVHGEVLAVNEDGSVRTRVCGTVLVPRPARWPEGTPTPVVGQVYRFEVDFGDDENYTLLSVSGPLNVDCAPPPAIPSFNPGLMLTLKDTVNANATALTASDIDQTLAGRGFFVMQRAHSFEGPGVELDCAPNPDNPGGRTSGLVYCTPGGSGRVLPTLLGGTSPRSFPLAFPDCCDGDGDGFGALEPLERDFGGFSGAINAFYSHGATTEQIGTGDILNWRVTEGGVEWEFPQTLPDVFATVPALVSYRDGAGNSGIVSYPVPPPYVGSRPDYLGPFEGPYRGFPVAPCPTGAPAPCEEGDVVLTLEFWRPQREAIGAEQGPWTDIGRLVYSPGFSGPWRDEGDPPHSLASLPACARDDLSTTDPHLTPELVISVYGQGYGFRDSAPDQPANPANKLSFSVNVTDCLASTTGIPGNGGPWESGENVSMWLGGALGHDAAGGNSGATQQLLFTLK